MSIASIANDGLKHGIATTINTLHFFRFPHEFAVSINGLKLSMFDDAEHVVHVEQAAMLGKSVDLFVPTSHMVEEVRTTIGLE